MAHLDSRTLTVLAALGFCLIAVPAGAATETVLYSFQGAPNGGSPSGALSADASGNLYGATSVGGTGSCLAGAENEGCGTIYQLSPPPTGQTGWTEKVLYSFKAGTDGADPQAGLATGTGGVLYGTTTGGGDSDNQGVVFQLTPPAAGKTAWVEKVLYRFAGGSDGAQPYAGLVADASGALYGTTTTGGGGTCPANPGASGCGTVFKLTPPAKGQTAWAEQVLYVFKGGTLDGFNPQAGLIADSAGDLYGTTTYGGGSGCSTFGCGVAFKLSPPATGKTQWTETVIYRFRILNNGQHPKAGLLTGPAGSLYGAASAGGYKGNGVVFQLTPPTSGKGIWTEIPLYRFQGGDDGGGPFGGLIKDSVGTLYGTTVGGGNACTVRNGCGTAFKLVPPAGQSQWTETVLYRFTNGTDGGVPFAGLTANAGGVLFGTTPDGGSGKGAGTVFSLTGTGFAP